MDVGRAELRLTVYGFSGDSRFELLNEAIWLTPDARTLGGSLGWRPLQRGVGGASRTSSENSGEVNQS
jgi:hypothetical protein